jgi:transcriptional regulator
VIEEDGSEIILKSHMAKANPQWKEFDGKTKVLVIFQEPHSYISPQLYDHKRNVPTWNYIAVHAYGKPELIAEENETVEILELMFRQFDESYRKQWDELDTDYKNKMLKGIAAFKIKVNKLEGKFKLSQNKTDPERERIRKSLENDPDTIKFDLSKYM